MASIVTLGIVGLTAAGAEEVVMMPDGVPFDFWDDTTVYTRVYHVAGEHPAASDDNPGTETLPFATISRAAALLQPGEKVVVQSGVYRECVRPARGGEGPDRMIAYEAAPGATVRILGSEPLTHGIRPSEDWVHTSPTAPTIWMADLPPAWFADTGYNPFIANNMTAEYTTFTQDWTPEETRRQQLRRGMVFANGIPLQQVLFSRELYASNGVFWVEEPGLRIHFRLPGDANPDDTPIEVTAREQVFTPAVRGLGYIRVSGFHMKYAADGVPIPQRALLSAYRGHHWIIEDNRLRWANGVGIDIGGESWHARSAPDAPSGGHIVRRNRIADCGICGIAGVSRVNGSRLEDNLIERIGGHDIERMWETGGIKLHSCNRVLIRRNTIRNLRHAPGLWLDYRVQNTRVSGNLFMDIEARNGALYLEVSQGPNVIDHNVFWGIRADRPRRDKAHALNVDTSEKCTAAHNLFVDVPDGFAIAMHISQSSREVAGRTGLGRDHAVLNNVMIRCRKRILFERFENNRSDGHFFDRAGDAMSLQVEYPAPRSILNLEAWQEFFAQDRASRQAPARATFDPDTGRLTVEIDGDLPVCAPVPILGDPPDTPPHPGPFPFVARTDRDGPAWRAEYPFPPDRL